MTHTNLTKYVFRAMTAVLLVTGIVTTGYSSLQVFTASATGQGSIGGMEEKFIQATTSQVLVSTLANDLQLRLVIGMLLVLAGFGFYALGVVRSERSAALQPRRRIRRKLAKLGLAFKKRATA